MIVMKRIRSFIAALLILILLAGTVHAVTADMSLKVNNGRFGFWYSPYKDLAWSALTENISPNTVLLMGSSEFHHGRGSRYHPMNMLAVNSVDVLTIGGPGNQILFHTIATGALEEKLRSRKVILLISPTWFRKIGVGGDSYGMRFSESEYIRFMENDRISSDLKQYVASRNTRLLRSNSSLRGKVGLINRKLAYGERSMLTNLLFTTERFLAFERDRITSALAVNVVRQLPEAERRDEVITPEQFRRAAKKAEKNSISGSSNPFLMLDKSWWKKYSHHYESGKLYQPNRMCKDSKEFDDLTAFLEVCRQTGIQAKLIIQPVNGRWFDFIGTEKKQRRETVDRIIKLADEYGVETADLTTHEYESYITKDAVHPWKKGWVLISREIYEFCNERRR